MVDCEAPEQSKDVYVMTRTGGSHWPDTDTKHARPVMAKKVSLEEVRIVKCEKDDDSRRY
jgi:hypothetical protein